MSPVLVSHITSQICAQISHVATVTFLYNLNVKMPEKRKKHAELSPRSSCSGPFCNVPKANSHLTLCNS